MIGRGRTATSAIAEFTELPQSAVSEAIEDNCHAEIFRPDAPVGFVHPLVREAVYRDIPAGERELLHIRASQLLEKLGAPTEKVAAQLIPVSACGDPWALGLWHELAPLLAVTLGNAVAVLNPERLVLGGGVLARCPTLYRLVTEAMAETTNGPSWGPLSVVLAELGDDAGLVGAAHLAAS